MTRPRAVELDLDLGSYRRGFDNDITDVAGVRVGHVTLQEPPSIHTGVTAVVPENIGPYHRLRAGFFAGNGRGKFIGSTQVVELGEIESPIVLTATLSAFRAADALVTWMMRDPRNGSVVSFNPVVGECNDGGLSDIRSRPVTEEHVLAAIDGAALGPIAQGSVGAGTGTVALGYKAGIGSSSRIVEVGGADARVGVLVQANFGGRLRRPDGARAVPSALEADEHGSQHGSCVFVIATDHPLDARQLGRLARRAVFALARVGSAYGHESGDYALAFSTSQEPATTADQELSPLFEAVLDAAEESVLDALLAAEDTTDRNETRRRAMPLDRLRP